eukprot:4287758-Amphidinium_carterae.2
MLVPQCDKIQNLHMEPKEPRESPCLRIRELSLGGERTYVRSVKALPAHMFCSSELVAMTTFSVCLLRRCCSRWSQSSTPSQTVATHKTHAAYHDKNRQTLK